MLKKFFGFSMIFIVVVSCTSKIEYLPKSIYGLTLAKKISGEDAIEYVNRLHFGDVAAVNNEIGFYSSDKGKAIIYVSFYSDYESAGKNLNLMVKKISPHNSVFRGGENFELNNIKIFKYLGMGQTHFVFAHNNVLVWLSVEDSWAEKYLKEYLDYIK